MVEDTQKRYADDITLQELVRLRVENEQLHAALKKEREISDLMVKIASKLQNRVDRIDGVYGAKFSIIEALQQKESE